MATKSVLDPETPPGLSTGEDRLDGGQVHPSSYDKVEIERLGRERPPSLPNRLIEIGFISVVVMSMTMSEFFISGFNIILPRLAEAIDIPETLQAWPSGVINLTTAALLMVFSRACDIYGGRAVFLAGHAWLMLWSLICGFSKSYVMLIVCRAMQGIGVAAFMPAGLFLFSQTYRPGPRKNRVFAIWGAFASVGFYSGIFIGAVSTQYLTWRWYFWIGTILDAAVVVAGWVTIPRNLHQRDPLIRMDWWAIVTMVPGLVLVVYALTDGGHAPHGWKTPYIYVTCILGVLFLLAAFYTQGWVSSQPLVPAALFKPKYLGRLFSGLFCAYGVFGLYMFYASYYIQDVMHIGPFLSAAWFAPLAIGGMCLSIGGGLVMHLIPNRVLMLISCVGFLVTSMLFEFIPQKVNGHPSTSFIYWAYVFPAMICGTIGIDIAFNTSNVFITTQMPMRLQAAASGFINSLFYLSLAFWLGVSEIAVSEAGRAKGSAGLDPRQQYKIPFWMSVALAGLSLVFMSTVKMGAAAADLTADEKAALETDGPSSPSGSEQASSREGSRGDEKGVVETEGPSSPSGSEQASAREGSRGDARPGTARE